ncbi:hypothetical protein FIU87_10725 [Bacillus sp. THAF10]|uniref:hypothetical protein n=1 Tax=Bacillus sp. THAF10 TaxID=2587848 RepID=UPI0012684126|nr:hypothetical protein [Bacillus sp. THAF10]QFT89121.1 hypothetical protein FIU87_10725 [Bacillus sp. THAF10]
MSGKGVFRLPSWIIRGNRVQITTGIIKMHLELYEHLHVTQLEIGDKIYYADQEGIEYICKLTSSTHEECITLTMEIVEYGKLLTLKNLRKIWGLKNLDLFRLENIKVQPLTMEEDQLLYSFWKIPGTLKGRAAFEELDQYLFLYKSLAENWIGDIEVEEKRYHYFQRFRMIESLSCLEWKDIQELGDQLSIFQFPLARERALGQKRVPLEQYRKSFLYFALGEGLMEERIQNFYASPDYKLTGFGQQAVGELLHYLFPHYFCRFSKFECIAVEAIYKEAARINSLSLGTKIQHYQQLIQKSFLADKYIEIVGRKTELPIFYEISCFLYYFYKEHVETKDEKVLLTRSEDVQYWMCELPDGKFHLENGLLIMQHGELGDIRTYKSKQDLWQAMRELNNQKDSYLHASALYQFCHKMKVGDYVFIRNAEEEIIGLGKIASEYMFPKFSNAPSYRKMEVLKTGRWKLKGRISYQNKLLNLTKYERTLTYLLDFFIEK